MDKTSQNTKRQIDWASGRFSFPLIWMLPKLAIVSVAFASVPLRAAVWTAALAWMGFACMLNSRRCGRVHCRYTGPYYLLLACAVFLAGIGVLPAEEVIWFLLGVMALLGGAIITFFTERAWGYYEK